MRASRQLKAGNGRFQDQHGITPKASNQTMEPIMSMTLTNLQDAVSNASVIRLNVDLSPLTADGLVFPPT